MHATSTRNDCSFLKEFLMARGRFDPRDFGVDLEREVLQDEIVSHFAAFCRGEWTVDELLLHPREALHFCDEFRRSNGYFQLPDDVILRSLMTRRKNP
jgi:hypothetical protein